MQMFSDGNKQTTPSPRASPKASFYPFSLCFGIKIGYTSFLTLDESSARTGSGFFLLLADSIFKIFLLALLAESSSYRYNSL